MALFTRRCRPPLFRDPANLFREREWVGWRKGVTALSEKVKEVDVKKWDAYLE